MTIGTVVANHITKIITESEDGEPNTKEVLLRDCVPILQGTLDNYYQTDNRQFPEENIFIIVNRHAGMIIKAPRDPEFIRSIKEELKPMLVKKSGPDFPKSLWGVLSQAVKERDAQGALIAALLRIEATGKGGIEKFFELVDAVKKEGYIGVGVVMAWSDQTDDNHEDTAGIITITALPLPKGPVAGTEEMVLH
jgi:hypothetical protein